MTTDNPVGSTIEDTPIQAHVRRRLQSIDLLRGTAALAVLLHHAITYADNPPVSTPWFNAIFTIVTLGDMGVPLFFVISGFCIHLSWAGKKRRTGQESLSFVSFWGRRIQRLYPPYFVALCLSMGLVLLAYVRGANVPLVTAYPHPRLQWMGLDFLIHVPMLHGFHPLFDKLGGNPPFWTLAQERLYLLYFVVLPWRKHFGMASVLALVVLVGIATPLLIGLFLPPDSDFWKVVVISATVLWGTMVPGDGGGRGLLRIGDVASLVFESLSGCPMGHLAHSHRTLSAIHAQISIDWNGVFFTNELLRWPGTVRAMAEPLDDELACEVGVFFTRFILVHYPVRAVVKRLLGEAATTAQPISYPVFAAVMAASGYIAGRLFFWFVERHFLFAATTPSSNEQHR